MVLIEGRIKTRNWQDTAGVKHYKTEIIAELMQMGPKGGGDSSNSNYGKSSSMASEAQGTTPRQEEIPIIEENYTPPANDTPEEQKTVSFEDHAADEINIKDIPF